MRGVGGVGEPEVHEYGPGFGHQDVAGLHIPVDQARAMHVHQGTYAAGGQPPHQVLGQRAARAHQLVQRRRRNVLGRQPRRRGERIGRDDVRGVAAAHPPGSPYLTHEALAVGRIGRQLRADDLDRGEPRRCAVPEEDAPHRPGAEHTQHREGPDPLRSGGVRWASGAL